MPRPGRCSAALAARLGQRIRELLRRRSRAPSRRRQARIPLGQTTWLPTVVRRVATQLALPLIGGSFCDFVWPAAPQEPTRLEWSEQASTNWSQQLPSRRSPIGSASDSGRRRSGAQRRRSALSNLRPPRRGSVRRSRSCAVSAGSPSLRAASFSSTFGAVGDLTSAPLRSSAE